MLVVGKGDEIPLADEDQTQVRELGLGTGAMSQHSVQSIDFYLTLLIST